MNNVGANSSKKNILYYAIFILLLATYGCEKGIYEEPLLNATDSIAVTDSSCSIPTDTIHYSYDDLSKKIREEVPAEEDNLLVNGHMEKWIVKGYENLDGWYCHNNSNLSREYRIRYDGLYSAKMQSREKGSTATVDQSVKVNPGKRIRIYFHYYFEKWKENGARTYCYFKTASPKNTNLSTDELRMFFDVDTYYVIRGGGYGKKYLPFEKEKWQTFDETIVVPPTANYFTFGINSYFGTILYVDGCYVMECH